jgi:hypothetical protein
MLIIYRILSVFCFISALFVWLAQPDVDIFQIDDSWLLGMGITETLRFFIGWLAIVGMVVTGAWLWRLRKKRESSL